MTLKHVGFRIHKALIIGIRVGMVWALVVLPTVVLAGSGGQVLPPTAQPCGYSLTDMSQETGVFSSGSNDPVDYPDTPFQVLYVDFNTMTYTSFEYKKASVGLLMAGKNTFTVAPGTSFYVPLWNADDSPPVVGVFPTEHRQASSYMFDPKVVGAQGFEVIVDGKRTPVGPEFVAGPVETPTLKDGGGTHIITLGVFLSPLTPGTHTVEIKGALLGDAVLSVYQVVLAEDHTYTVIVKPEKKRR